MLTKKKIAEIESLFIQINKECLESKEDQCVPLTDIDYYTQQIHNIYGFRFSKCRKIATIIAKKV